MRAGEGETDGMLGGMTDSRITVEEGWERFYRWGPYGALGLSVLLSLLTFGIITTPRGLYVGGVLVTAAVALQVWRGRALRLGDPPGSAGGQVYYWMRAALAFALNWINPFFGVYAVLGYFDPGRLLPGRAVRAGLLATAVIMAGSNMGGFPPQGAVSWGAFGALFVLHGSLTLVFGHLGGREEERARARAATIEELERANTHLEQALRDNAALQNMLVVQAREAGVTQERQRLAAEIHDTIAQGLTGIITQLQAATAATDEATSRAHVTRAATLARTSLGEARRSVQNLGPGALEHHSLAEALKKAVDAWTEEFGVQAMFTITGTVEPLHEEVEATLLRIAQEALANAGRHAEAGRVGVTLSYMDDEVTLDVRDDGRGFDLRVPHPRESPGGFGLGGMRARAARLAGTVDVESEPGQGTAVSARVPLVRHG
ncbi:two-component system sensor kinase [Streptomyces xiamenensis]|uniref:Two-component system sensor kinase n=2 Tax=Streptomyces xiamenensis TaxID=408015 RepID=A0A0F7FRJ2_9ACTN|nr:two-component system sensor kinase [Streptomyces xiamenensis]